MKLKSLLYGVVAGGAIASITTLLLTPKSGKELQNSLVNTANTIKNNLNETKEHTISLKNQFSDTAKISKEAIDTVSKDVKISIDDWKQEVEPALKQLQKEIDDLQEALQGSGRSN
ncbi:YtxH domain-containing protein [Alkalihalobacterium elongatum]|uniref:YtxH domain-containing protein n=1 Tax=Alkalihalobacterium elongatum TaxID=2675466 RepID=UPI001C1F6116|nr:YtxH domain-containing protein [Alkalihalobacterium elongatum]